MESVHENDQFNLPFPFWVAVENSSRRGVMVVAAPNDYRAAPLFSTQEEAREFIESRSDDMFTVGEYEPDKISEPAEFIEYLSMCESEGIQYVGYELDIDERTVRGRFRRITAVKTQLIQA